METQFYHLQLKNPLLNASGVKCMTTTDLKELIQSNIGSIITKTCTPSQRNGNPSPRYYEVTDKSLTINSMGLPNEGLPYYLDFYKTLPNSINKGRFLSLGGLNINDNLLMLDTIFQQKNILHYLDVVEINLSCPNIVGKAQLGYDFQNLESYLQRIFDKIFELENNNKNTDLDENNKTHNLIIGCKLPPYFDMSHFKLVANILKKFTRLNYVNCINSIGNGLVIDTDTEQVVIKPKNGFGGLGGKIVKPTALANVHQFYKLLGKDIKIIGCGGVTNGEDLFQMILAGATLVAIGSQIMIEGVECINRIMNELEEIMKKKGYNSINDFRGKLNYMN